MTFWDERYMEVFIATLVLVAICFVGLGFNIIFRKNGKFPETEISNNKEMKKLGIKCAKEDEMKMWGDQKHRPDCDELGCSSCTGCDLHPKTDR